MKWLLLVSAFTFQTEIFCQQFTLQQMRELFLRALDHKTALDSLTSKLQAIEKKTPTQEGYFGLCIGLYCYYDKGNLAKMKHVIQSKNHLNSAVERDPKNPEVHYLRFVFEHFLPSFLGLNKHLPRDLEIVMANLNFIDDSPRVKKRVLEFLLWTKRGTAEQNKLLQTEMDGLNKKAGTEVVKKGR